MRAAVEVGHVRRPMCVGNPLNFRSLIYEPVNENGVIFLFALVARELGFYVEGIRESFPDAFGKRRKNERLYPVEIEFKFRSSGYKQYYKRGLLCDVIVCWRHDWKDCPIEVIELSSKIRQLTHKIRSLRTPEVLRRIELLK